MKSKSYHIVLACLILLCVCMLNYGCKNSSTYSKEYMGDTVVVEIIKLSDTSSFKKSNGELCDINTCATVAIPAQYKDNISIQELRKLFVKHVLYCSDSLSIEDALKLRMGNMLHQYDFADDPHADEMDLDDTMEDIKNYNNSVTVTVYYNKHAIFTLCKVEVVKKDNVVTSITHRYYSFDLKNMSFIDLNGLFKEDTSTALCNEILNQLLTSNKVTSRDQLNEIGYYNIDNLGVTRNFYFDKTGITWSYLPNELAVEALGEPTVTLSYETLEPYLSDNSVINRLY